MKQLILAVAILFSITTTQAQKITAPTPLPVGEAAPDFLVPDAKGNNFSLQEQLRSGDLVLIFYRGQWCPYCMKELNAFNDSLSLITDKGASVVAVTPETYENIKLTQDKTNASFPILSDQDQTIMKLYGVNYAIDAETIEKYRGYGIDLNETNGTNGANLPVPAIYIIKADGSIKYVWFDTDYKKRPAVQHILDKL